MSSVVLGLSGAIGHDPAAALFVDGELVAAVEEERLIRRRHARGEHAFLAASQCLRMAGLRGNDVNIIAIPYAPTSPFSRARWHYAYRHWYAPDRSIDSLFNGNRRYRRYRKELNRLLEKLLISPNARIAPVEHQLAHASSIYHLTENDQPTAIFCNDYKGEYSNILFGVGEGGAIRTIKEFYNPDSLCGMYAALTDYLGFEILDGEFKVMGISPFGDPDKYDLSALASFNGKRFKVDNTLIGTVGIRRYKAKQKGHYFSRKLVEKLGPRRVGNLVDDPYVHYAAAIQKLYEDLAVEMVRHYLGPTLKRSGRLAVAGTGSLNIRLNRRLSQMPEVTQFLVHSACGDPGTAIGAAAWVVRQQGHRIKPISNLSLGPSYSDAECIDACINHREKPEWEVMDAPFSKVVDLLEQGELVAWFRGRMEFGARALGNRSILANPTIVDIRDKLNSQVKFRESWRPFSPSVLDHAAQDFLADQVRDEYMCVCLNVSDEWRRAYPAIVGEDGSTRAQIVSADGNPDLHRVLEIFEQRTGHPLLINTSLSRPGEALVCSPEHAIDMFLGTDLNYLVLGNLLVTRRAEKDTW